MPTCTDLRFERLNRLFWGINFLLLSLLLISCRSSPVREELARDYYNIGNAYFDLGEYEKAVEYYDRSLELDPGINQAVFNLARTNIETGRYKKSLKLLSQLELKDSENIMVLEMIAFTYYKMEKVDLASEYYRKILDINLYSKRALYNLSLIEKGEGRLASSRSYLERLLELGDKQEYRVLLAELALAEGDREEAIAQYESLLLEDNPPYTVYSALKDLYIETEQYFGASEMFDLLLNTAEGQENRKNLLFERCRIEFLYLDDIISAQENLIQALDLGYGREDRASLDQLLEEVDAVLKDQVERIIKEHLLGPEELSEQAVDDNAEESSNPEDSVEPEDQGDGSDQDAESDQ